LTADYLIAYKVPEKHHLGLRPRGTVIHSPYAQIISINHFYSPMFILFSLVID